MTMLDESLVRRTMRTRLKTVSVLPDALAWEGRTFQPPTLEDAAGPLLWVAEQQVILSEVLAASCTLEAIGETAYLVFTPEWRGTEAADTLCKAIAEAFEPVQSLTATGLSIILERVERRPFRGDDRHPAWIFKAVAIRWRSFTSTS
mgnify:CR=1 FL=1